MIQEEEGKRAHVGHIEMQAMTSKNIGYSSFFPLTFNFLKQSWLEKRKGIKWFKWFYWLIHVFMFWRLLFDQEHFFSTISVQKQQSSGRWVGAYGRRHGPLGAHVMVVIDQRAARRDPDVMSHK